MPLFLLVRHPDVSCLLTCRPGRSSQKETFPETSSGLLSLGSGSWQHVLALPSSVGCPERHLGPSPLATQDLARCPLPTEFSTDGSWLNWISLEWLMDSLYQNLTVLHKMFLPVLHIIHYRSGCSVLWVLFFSISHNASRNICLTITSLMGFMCAFANTGN